jgi:probable HAF family extracellular repeat protein
LGGKDAGLGLSINNAGHVVGYTTDSLGAHATSWVNGAMTDLGTLGGPGSTAYFISPRGLILGMSTISSDTSFGHAVLWDEQRQRLDLNTLLDKSGSGWTLLDARAMNASGQIIGNGRTPNGAQHGYLLIPTVEPTAHVVGVKVSGFAWSDETYSMPVGSADQLRPLPWIGADQVTLTFDQQVVLQRDDMVVIDGAGSRRRLFGPVVSNDAAGTSSATWQIDGPLPRGATTLLLFDRVTDVFGNALDGEWADGVSVRSGDGLPGGPFAFHLNLLPGDANQDGSVNLIDAIGVRDRMGSVPALDGSFYDFDRNGVINRGDIAILARNLFAQVPPAAGAVPVPEPSTTTLALVGAAFIGLAAFTRRRSGAAVRESR